MADEIEKAERAISILMRLAIAAILPIWALAMLAIGLEYQSPWWIGTGAGIRHLRRDPVSPPKPCTEPVKLK